ncbi:hypothetical protein NDU88_001259 [Pleurodeles waltl]|uniref:Uncharacterized protein n=1 Tax=Pleurodeles waltl TaxID=8319 RepID=A0AAV7P3D3_PLEWA|nr:hypothetical protein NDU88_001259 [Pleurodeles waltl]
MGGATIIVSVAFRLVRGEMRPSWEGSAADRGVPARLQPLESRGAERSERSSAAAATLPQVKGRVQSHCRGAIPGARVLQFSGGPRLPAGLPRSAQRARGPGGRPRAVSSPAAGVSSAGRQLLLGS